MIIVDVYNVWNYFSGLFRMYLSIFFVLVLLLLVFFKNLSIEFEFIGDGMGGVGVEFSKVLGGNYLVE